MALIKINGRLKFFERVQSVEKTGVATWRVVAQHGVYRVEGGRNAGGARDQWFLDGGAIKSGHIPCTSLVDACRVINSM